MPYDRRPAFVARERFRVSGRAVSFVACILAVTLLTAAAPAQFSPANGEVRAGTSVAFTWPAVGGAARYAVQVDFTAGALGVGSPFQATTVGAETTVNVIGLPNDGSQLFWRVVPSDSFGDDLPPLATQNFINGSSFTLASPIPYKPADGAVVPIGAINSLGWNFVNRANSYVVQVDTDMGFPSPTETTVFGTYAAGPPASLANAGMQFFWKVRAVYTPPNPMGTVEMSPFCATQSFTIGMATGPDIDSVPVTAHFAVSAASPTGQTNVQIISRGDSDLNVTSATKRAGADWITGFSFFAANGTTPINLPQVLPANQRIVMRVNVDATALSPGSFQGFIDFASNDPDENPYTVTIALQLSAAPTPATCSPADMPPFGNSDGFISQAEADAYAQAFINGQHDDLLGVVEANQIAANGGFCPGGNNGATCDEIMLNPKMGTVCVDTTDLAMTPFTFTASKISTATGASVKLKKLSGDGKVTVTKMSDMSTVLGPDDTESPELASDLAAAAITFVVTGDTPGMVTLQLELVNSSSGSDINCPPNADNQIVLTVVKVDLDVDSDNNNGTPDFAPARDMTEEMLENDGGSQGRIIALNDDDDDNDMITDLGDGYNLDCSGGACELASTTYEVTNVLAGDVTLIDLSSRNFTDFFFVGPAPNTVATTTFTDVTLSLLGEFAFIPRTGPGDYVINNIHALCGTTEVPLTINIHVVDGYSQLPATGLTLSVGDTNSLLAYRIEHRLNFFGFPAVGPTPIVVNGEWTAADASALRLFTCVVFHRQFGPASYSTNLPPTGLIHDWLSATNAPRWQKVSANDPVAGVLHPGSSAFPASRTAVSWVKATMAQAVASRAHLISNSAGAPAGKIALLLASLDFTVGLDSATSFSPGYFINWTYDPIAIDAGGTFPNAGEQALIADILAFKNAATTLGPAGSPIVSVTIFNPSSGVSAGYATRMAMVRANLLAQGIPAVSTSTSTLAQTHFLLVQGAPPIGPQAPLSSPTIN